MFWTVKNNAPTEGDHGLLPADLAEAIRTGVEKQEVIKLISEKYKLPDSDFYPKIKKKLIRRSIILRAALII